MQGVDWEKVVVEIDKLFGEVGYAVQEEFDGGAIECGKERLRDDIFMQDDSGVAGIYPTRDLTFGADDKEDLFDERHIRFDTP